MDMMDMRFVQVVMIDKDTLSTPPFTSSGYPASRHQANDVRCRRLEQRLKIDDGALRDDPKRILHHLSEVLQLGNHFLLVSASAPNRFEGRFAPA